MPEQPFDEYEPLESSGGGVKNNGAPGAAMVNPYALDPESDETDLELEMDHLVEYEAGWTDDEAMDDLYAALDEYDEFIGADFLGDHGDLPQPSQWFGDGLPRSRARSWEVWDDQPRRSAQTGSRQSSPGGSALPAKKRRSGQQAPAGPPREPAQLPGARLPDGEARPTSARVPSAGGSAEPDWAAMIAWMIKRAQSEADATGVSLLTVGVVPLVVARAVRPAVAAAILPALLRATMRWTQRLQQQPATRRLLTEIPPALEQVARQAEERAVAGYPLEPRAVSAHFTKLMKARLASHRHERRRRAERSERFLDEAEW